MAKKRSVFVQIEEFEQKRRARVEDLCVLAKELIRVVREAPSPEHALSSVLTVLVELDDG